ncbi:MAG: aminotransferase class III-fold pyridoxal phosphate-dependent enzyme, partial [Gammaproteobacteria bacterium]
KVVGGGLPVGAFGGRRDIMEQIAPLGPVYQAGTLSGNPVAMAAGLATLELVRQPGFHDQLEATTAVLLDGLRQEAAAAGIGFTTNQVGSMFGLFFTEAPTVHNFAEVSACDQARFRRFFHAMLKAGVYLAPSAFEAGFVSSAHDEAAIETTLQAAAKAFKTL